MKDRICEKCKRRLQLSTHDKCMFCGEPIPEIFKLSEYEKEKIQADRDDREKKRKAKKSNTEGSCGIGGVCGGSCGGE